MYACVYMQVGVGRGMLVIYKNIYTKESLVWAKSKDVFMFHEFTNVFHTVICL